MGCGPLAGGTARRLMLAGGMTAPMPVAVPAAALAHIERTAYWPDPAPDASVTPALEGLPVPHRFGRPLQGATRRPSPATA
jgi:hypothetical protein